MLGEKEIRVTYAFRQQLDGGSRSAICIVSVNLRENSAVL
jgi:hypothetical protein